MPNDFDDDSSDEDGISLASDEISCSLTMPPVPTAYEIEQYRQIRNKQLATANAAAVIDNKDDLSSTSTDDDKPDTSKTAADKSTATVSLLNLDLPIKQDNSFASSSANEDATDATRSDGVKREASSESAVTSMSTTVPSTATTSSGSVDTVCLGDDWNKELDKDDDDLNKDIDNGSRKSDADNDVDDVSEEDDNDFSPLQILPVHLSPVRREKLKISRPLFPSSLSIASAQTVPVDTTTTSNSNNNNRAGGDKKNPNQSSENLSSSLSTLLLASPVKNNDSSGQSTKSHASISSLPSPKNSPKKPSKLDGQESSVSSTPSTNGKTKSGSPKKPKKAKSSDDSSRTKSSNVAKTTTKSSSTSSIPTIHSTADEESTILTSPAPTTVAASNATATAVEWLPGNATASAFLDGLFRETINVQHYGVELPVIAVMGDTSSGKSSLLSQLCHVELPASQSFTTRCPVRLRMKRDPNKLAVITVEWRSHIVSNQYADFAPQTVTAAHWDRIPIAIAQAQQFILENTNREVTNDIVCVQVQGPEYMVELTVIDLPGIVRSKAGRAESESLPSMIAALQQEYLRNPRCIIVAVHPANVDWHNAQITADALAVDLDTSRTVTVLTKPDLIDKGAEHDVVHLLQGQRYLQFQHGLHIIKSRGQAALDSKNVSLAEALEDEARYFERTEPWKSVADRSLFGTARLRQKLGELQVLMIRSTLPKVMQEIREKQQAAALAIEAMGEMHDSFPDRRRYYQDVCRAIVTQVSASLSGKGGKHNNKNASKNAKHGTSAAASLHDDCSHFRDRIQEGSLATIRKVVEGGTVLVAGQRGSIRGEVVHMEDSSFACVDFLDENDKNSDVLFDATGLKANEKVEENDVWSNDAKINIARKNNRCDVLKKIPLASIRTDPTWLKEKIAGNRTDDLACFLNIDIFKNIVEEFIALEWQPHALRLLDLTRETMLATMEDAVKVALSKGDRYPSLRTLVTQQCRGAAHELIVHAHQQILAHFGIETHPYTQDKELFEKIASGRHRTLRRELEVALKVDSEGVFDTQAIQAIMDGVFERHRLQSVEDQMAEEMEIVLDAYGSVAARRVVDRTPMICWEVFRLAPNSIQDSLWNVKDDVLLHYMQEDPNFTAKYMAAQDELKAMNTALELFESLA